MKAAKYNYCNTVAPSASVLSHRKSIAPVAFGFHLSKVCLGSYRSCRLANTHLTAPGLHLLGWFVDVVSFPLSLVSVLGRQSRIAQRKS